MDLIDKELYPNIDISVWTRTCDEEIPIPIIGKTTGTIPHWLNGCLLRNGPGATKVGSMEFNHLFDCSALLHRFAVKDGRATYQCRFLRSTTFKKNRTANRIVVSEFGTESVPDPCHTIFDRLSSIFKPLEAITDNNVISLYPFGDQIYALAEVPFIHRINPMTLDTLERKKLIESTVVVCHTSHPHVMPNGDVYNVGLSALKGRPRHVIVKFPYVETGDMFDRASVVGSVTPRWALNPSYMHSFGITENYFVILEQPLVISLMKSVYCQLTGAALRTSLNWYPEYETEIVLISRSTGEETSRYKAKTFFFVHIINCFEKDEILNVDLCTYKDANIIDGMYLEALKNMQSNPNYAEWFRSKAERIEIPLKAPAMSRVQVRQLSKVGCEVPRINYSLCNGKPYRYFYAISSDVDAENPGSLIKVDVNTGEVVSWKAEKCFASEPVFVAAPDAKEEDDGVLLSSLLYNGKENLVTLLILDAKNMREIARSDFVTPSAVPRDFHGWFLPAAQAQRN